MNVNLMYKINGRDFLLKSDTLENMDIFTSTNFDNYDSMFSYFSKRIGSEFKDGIFVLTYNAGDVLFEFANNLYSKLGNNPFKQEQELSIITKQDNIDPKLEEILLNIATTLAEDDELLEQFYLIIEDDLTEKEKLLYAAGKIHYQNFETTRGIVRIIKESIKQGQSYFASRIIRDGIMKIQKGLDKEREGKKHE